MGKGKQGRTSEAADRQRRQAMRAADSILAAASRVAEEVQADSIMLYIDGVSSLDRIGELAAGGRRLILLARGQEQADGIELDNAQVLVLPAVRLSRVDQLRMAILFAFSQRLLDAGETFVGLAGLAGEPIDSLMVMTVGREWEIFQSVDQPPITEHIRRAVFQRVINLAVQLAAEGREGKPVGAIFVLGDTNEVLKYADQMILNPFHGYAASQRSVLDESLAETIREFSTLDGAFLIRGNGEIVSAGVYLRPSVPGEELPQGLGARHATAAAITATTECLAVTISESTGTVRLWRRGQMITEIRKGGAVDENEE
jgi:DNA integrity scanning protein DisA with diadenylate cyclase activity